MDKERRQKFFEIIRDTLVEAQYCFLITLDEQGLPNARLMQPFKPEDDLVVHLGAGSDSRKVRELLVEPRAALGYALPDAGAYVTLQGTTELVQDAAAKPNYWRESFAAFWPDGAHSDGYAVIRFEPNRIEIMHFNENIAPDPYGLKPASLVKVSGEWEIEYA